MMKEYDIQGRIFVQRPLVLGQIQQLLRVLDGISLPEPLTLASLLDALGERLYQAVAVVITEKGCSPGDKDIEELAGWIRWSVDAETMLRIVDDFFVMNPVSSLLEQAGALIGALSRRLQEEAPRATGSTKPSSSWPAGTSPVETPSSGDSPSGNASRG